MHNNRKSQLFISVSYTHLDVYKRQGWKAIGNSIAYDSDGSLITVLPYGESEECVQVIDVHLTDKKVTGTALSEKIEKEVCL